ADHGLARPRGGPARRGCAAPSIAVCARQRQGSFVAGNRGTDRRAEMRNLGRALVALAAVSVVAVAVVGGGTAAAEQAKTLTIGWAYDGVGNMAPFDGPALATAKSHIATINKAGGTKVRLLTCNTQGNKPAIAKACARKLLSQGADVVMTTCDVDYAAPVV